MKKKINHRPSRKMKQVFLVFCEGESEETYIRFLRKKYKLPIIPCITGLSIPVDKIKRQIKAIQIGDEEASVWIAENDDIPVTLESPSLDTPMERVKLAAPELLELNDKNHEDIALRFTSLD